MEVLVSELHFDIDHFRHSDTTQFILLTTTTSTTCISIVLYGLEIDGIQLILKLSLEYIFKCVKKAF